MELEVVNKAPAEKFGETLVKELRKELRKHKGEYPRLANLSNGLFSHQWVLAFAGGRIKNPHFPLVVQLAMLLGVRFQVHKGSHFNEFTP